MFTPNLSILTNPDETTITETITEIIRRSPRFNQWFTLSLLTEYDDPSNLYIECVHGNMQGNFNHHFVNIDDSPRDIVKKLIKFCPDLYCLDYALLKETQQ
tara:strand:+ start:277 stop:579 length:303 start_codon:yes stop_codon:yes gene_type:complete